MLYFISLRFTNFLFISSSFLIVILLSCSLLHYQYEYIFLSPVTLFSSCVFNSLLVENGHYVSRILIYFITLVSFLLHIIIERSRSDRQFSVYVRTLQQL